MGITGMFVPVWPTTIFLILAVCCFKRGSERLERWLLNHPRFGPTLRDWQDNGGIRMRTKWYALSALWLSLGLSSLFMKKPTTVILLAVIGVAVSAYIWTRPTLPDLDRSAS
ncbi:MAG: Inner membrane protein YbaN [Fimbriimonadaceae bacterium]|nr:Inner membrane protein YbaN [Fimbriimonadaceae bacterium]